MERNSSGNNLKYHSNISGRPFRSETNEINKKFKDSWDLTSSSSTTTETNIDGGDLMGLGFPWPPRSYTCSFCKREFKSAQALGGHMNVHRRDRARLRQFSPPPPVDQSDQPSFLNLNLDVNPKPKSSKLTQLSHKLPLPSLVSPPETPSSAAAPSPRPSIEIKKTVKTLFRVEEFMGSKCEKREIGGLDLEMGLLRESKEELDLELRLGCS